MIQRTSPESLDAFRQFCGAKMPIICERCASHLCDLPADEDPFPCARHNTSQTSKCVRCKKNGRLCSPAPASLRTASQRVLALFAATPRDPAAIAGAQLALAQLRSDISMQKRKRDTNIATSTPVTLEGDEARQRSLERRALRAQEIKAICMLAQTRAMLRRDSGMSAKDLAAAAEAELRELEKIPLLSSEDEA